VADRPSLEVESNPAGSYLFLTSSKELLHTALGGVLFFASGAELAEALQKARVSQPPARSPGGSGRCGHPRLVTLSLLPQRNR
jgi:hypothetical protein